MPSAASRARRLAPTLALLLALGLGAGPAPASAAAGNPAGRILGAVLAVTPATAAARASAARGAVSGSYSNNLAYHGGPVMHADHTYSVYWEPSGHVSSAAYKDQVDGYLSDVAGDSAKSTNVYATQSLYWDGAGMLQYDSSFAGRIVDTTPYPSGGCQGPSGGACLSDDQLQAELKRLVAAGGLPTGESTMYLIFTPPGVDTCTTGACSFSYFCAYHSWIGSGSTALIYADQPYVAGHSGCDIANHPNANDADPTVNVVSHEQNEAVTDPEGTGWWDAGGQEIGDKCAWSFGTSIGSTASGTYNQAIGARYYSLQQEWSNVGARCVLTNAADEAPTVSSTSSTSAPVPGAPVAFTATAADPDGSIASYSWDFGDGTSAAGSDVTHAYASFGTFTATVTVTDSDGQPATDTQTVTLLDTPVPVIGATPASPVAGASVSFDGSGSHSPSGSIASYFWSFYESDGGYSTATGARVTHVVLHPGTFEAYLYVTDSAGFSASTWSYLTVTARPPRAALSTSTTHQYPNLSIDFDGTASTGPDSPIASYRWDFGDGQASASPSPSHSYAGAGDYAVTLTVTDLRGQADTARATVNVVDRPPIPIVVYLPRSPVAGQPVEFDGSGSYAPDSTLAGYAWTFGDGTSAAGPAADHSFAAAGTYTVTLTTTDADATMATATRQVVVGPAPQAPAIAPSARPATVVVTSVPIAGPPPPPAGSIGLAGHQRLTGLRRSGLRFSVTCGTACRIAYAFVVPPRARANGTRTAETLLAGGTARLGATGTRRVTAHLSPEALRALRTVHRPVLLVELTDAATGATRWLGAATTVG